MNKAMAIDMGISFSLFSKLLSGKRPVTDVYAAKIYTFLNQSRYAAYGPKLTDCVCSAFHIPTTSMLYCKMAAKSYQELLRYLFYELKPEDIEAAADLKDLFISRLRSEFAQLLSRRSEECHGYSLVPDENTEAIRKMLEADRACILSAGRKIHGSWSEKICILIVPYDWHNEHKLFSDSYILDHFKHCMVVRLRKDQGEPVCIVDVDGKSYGTLAEFETIYIDRLYRSAGQLAETIFAKLCRDIRELEPALSSGPE